MDNNIIYDYIVKNVRLWTINTKELEKISKAKSLFVPTNVEKILHHGKNEDFIAFHDNIDLEKIDVDENNPFFYSNGNNVIIEKATQKLIFGCKNTNITNEVKIIGPRAFFRCRDIEKIVIPSSVIKIDIGAFGQCENLKEVIIKDGVKEIGDYAFLNTNIEKIVIPSSVVKIGKQIFTTKK